MERVSPSCSPSDPHAPDYVWQRHDAQGGELLEAAWGKPASMAEAYGKELEAIKALRGEKSEYRTFFRYPPVTVVLRRKHTGACGMQAAFSCNPATVLLWQLRQDVPCKECQGNERAHIHKRNRVALHD